ncbi:hypothetical protein SEUCBS139899_008304 [Sporothrix eucalyptigena]|uniref:C6 zinc finger domain containing protein n=1 Tax=Sporothrix eucalyptigena TaxID=1812306 RepID=A0ABP0AP21_9PEZI
MRSQRQSSLISVRENSFAPGTTVDVGDTPDSNGTSSRSRTTSVATSATTAASSVSSIAPSSAANGMTPIMTSGMSSGHGVNGQTPDVVMNGQVLPNGHLSPNGRLSNGLTNGHANGHSDDQPNGHMNGSTNGYTDEVDSLVNGIASNYISLNGVADDGAVASPPPSPARHTRTLRHSRSSPVVSRRIADQRTVPIYFDRIAESSPNADRSLIGSAREELLLATFWQAYLPNSSIFPVNAVGYASGGWTNVVQQLYRKDPVLHYTLMANCFSAAARHGDSRAMAEQSLRAHGRALHELRLALDNPKKARSDGVFSALRLMIVFSMFFSDRYEEDRRARARGWKEHNSGVLALLRARGPEAHTAGHGHQMFVDCRLALIVAAIRTRRRTILNQIEWMTIPWRNVAKTPKDTLIDIMSGIPGLLESVDYLNDVMQKSASPDDFESFRRKILATAWGFDQQLCEWYNDNLRKDRLQFLERSSFDDDDVDILTDGCSALPTEDLSIVYLMTVYCTACLLLYSTMHSLEIRNLPERANVSIYINRIASYLRLFFHPSTGQYGLEMTSFPLGLCLQILSSNFHTGGDPVKQRAKFTKLLETERGKEILDFLRSMLNTNETTKEDMAFGGGKKRRPPPL